MLPGYPRALLVKPNKRRVDKSLLSIPGRANNSRPTYYANRENVPITLDEAIFEVGREAILQKNVS